MDIILASKSPRRRELLSELAPSFEIITADTDEELDASVLPRDGVEILARRKGEAVYTVLKEENRARSERAVIISSDTLVALDDEALGKPEDESEAFRTLRALSGKRHFVHTGIAVRRGEQVVSGVASTAVYFKELTDEQIWAYVRTGDPMDKAGSYGIQSGAGVFVEKIEGDYDTVVGLSLRLLRELLAELGE